jgi:hypothetical protein
MFSNDSGHWRVLFLEFHHFVINLISAYKELSLLKFGSGGFIFSLLVGIIELIYNES